MANERTPNKQSARLSAEELAALDEGVQSAEVGQLYTWDEVKQKAREQRKRWQAKQAEISA